MAMTFSASSSPQWVVTKISGTAWLYGDDASKVRLSKSASLSPGNEVHTEKGARVLFARGAETMRVGPNSKFSLPIDNPEPGHTTILQKAGNILFDVEKKNVKHFSVETPFLAAVVKGTQFTVAIGKGATKVAVNRGKVEVQDNITKQIVNVIREQVAAVSTRGSRSGLRVSALDRSNSGEFSWGTPETFDAASANSAQRRPSRALFANAESGQSTSTSASGTTIQPGSAQRSSSSGTGQNWSYTSILSSNTEIALLVAGFGLLILHAATGAFRKRNRRKVAR